MSDKDFLSRWSRRKLGGAADEPAPPQAEPTEPAASEPLPVEAKAEDEFDPATLPPIESITDTTDITAFLRKGVPLELSRAALRRAWVSDPAIRDFVGLAENAWDFNDPTAMPGFGPLDQSPEEVRELVSRLFGETRRVVGEVADATDKLLPAPEAGISTESTAQAARSAATTDDAPVDGSANSASRACDAQNSASQQCLPVQEESRRRRTHGGALPT